MKTKKLTKLKMLIVTLLGALVMSSAFALFSVQAERGMLLYSEGDGYYAYNGTFSVDGDSNLSVSFKLNNILGKGEDYLGFGVVKDGEENAVFINEDNEEYGKAVLFGDDFRLLGFDAGATYEGKTRTEEVFTEGMQFRATFDNHAQVFVLETRAASSENYSVIFTVDGMGVLDDGDYKIAVMTSDKVRLLLEDLKFTKTESDDSRTLLSTTLSGVTQSENDAYSDLYCPENGYRNLSTTAAVTHGGSSVVISFNVLSFSAADNAKIGFAFGSSKSQDGLAYGGTNGRFYAFSQDEKVCVYKSNQSPSQGTLELVDCQVNMYSLFASGKTIKAVFSPSAQTVTVYSKDYGEQFNECAVISGVNYDSADYFGLQIAGRVSIKIAGESVYIPRSITESALQDRGFNAGGRASINGNSVKNTISGAATNGYLYSTDTFSLATGQLAAIEIRNVKNLAWGNDADSTKIGFTFGTQTAPEYMYDTGTATTVYFDSFRTCYIVKKSPNDGVIIGVQDNLQTRDSILTNGCNLLVTYSAESTVISVYGKAATSEEYTLLTSFNTKGTVSEFVASNTVYVGLMLADNISFDCDGIRTYKIKAGDVNVKDTKAALYSVSSDRKTGGVSYASASGGYIYADTVSTEGRDAVVEFSTTKTVSSDSSYDLGFIFTSGNLPETLPEGTDMIYRTTEDYTLLTFVKTENLTDQTIDVLRKRMLTPGLKMRVVYSPELGEVTVSSKRIDGYGWLDLITFTGLKVFDVNETFRFAVIVSGGASASFENFALSTGERTVVGTDYDLSRVIVTELESATLSTVKIRNENETYGTIYLTDNDDVEEGATQAIVITGSTVLAVAEAKDGYVFEGWFKNNALVESETEYEIVVQGYEELSARFCFVGLVVVNNGAGSNETQSEEFVKENSSLVISPINDARHAFVGWTISYKFRDAEENESTLSKYFIGVVSENGTGNILPADAELSVWKYLSNEIVYGDACTITEEYFSKVISFGNFKVIDNSVYADGTLVIVFPDFYSEFEDEQVVARKYVEITAEYADRAYVDTVTLTIERSDAYKNGIAAVSQWFTIVGVSAAAVIVCMVALKIYLVKKKAGKSVKGGKNK